MRWSRAKLFNGERIVSESVTVASLLPRLQTPPIMAASSPSLAEDTRMAESTPETPDDEELKTPRELAGKLGFPGNAALGQYLLDLDRRLSTLAAETARFSRILGEAVMDLHNRIDPVKK